MFCILTTSTKNIPITKQTPTENMTIPLYPEIIYEGDLSPDDVGEEIEEKVEVS